MLHYFKSYLNHVVEPTVSASALGAVCGGVSGVVGLYQMCSGNDGILSLDPCRNIDPAIIPASQTAALAAGAVAGSLIGLAAGAIFYPAYTGFIKLCRNNINRGQGNQSQTVEDGNGIDIGIISQ
ncbi:MAG: hypothetical protein KBG21_09490 [Ignavibacteria bacterium]|nr:hypothetical protein [Ignavibacteria bacterium]